MTRLLISDANILIDMECAGLLERMFDLPAEFAVLDVLLVEELGPDYDHLPGLGLQVLELRSAGVEDAEDMIRRHKGSKVSRMDILTLALARQESAPLLTGDAALRTVSETEVVEVHGTLWLMDGFRDTGLLDSAAAAEAYGRMRVAGRRLPWKEVEEQLKTWG